MILIKIKSVPYYLWARSTLVAGRRYQFHRCAPLYSRQLSSNARLSLIGARHLDTRFSSCQSKYAGCDLILHRYLRTSAVYFEKDSSKVEQTVKALKEASKQTDGRPADIGTPRPAADAQVAPAPKRSLGKRVWDELVHYYHGFRLLFIDIAVLRRLIWKVLNGESLSRREHKQMVRTVADLFRLLPFSVFIIVPFMEFLLPVFLKLFPNMLPSTFQTDTDKEVKFKKQLKLKIEMAKFLQKTLDEMALQHKGESHSEKAKEFVEFLDKIRGTGQPATNEEILKFSKLFEDEITLDSLTRPQLIAICRLLELQPIGTNNFLRFQLEMKLRSLQADDQVIQQEGIQSLTVPELQQACRARGMRALGVAEERLRFQLEQWLELSLNKKIPPSLLLLSRVLYLPENITPTDQLKASILSLSDAAATEARYKIGETEGRIDNRTKIELIKQQEEAINKEILELKTATEALSHEKAEELIDKAKIIHDRALAFGEERAKMDQDQEKEKLTQADVTALEKALEDISMEKQKLILEKEELEGIKEEMQDYKEDIDEFQQLSKLVGKEELRETKGARRLRKKVDRMLQDLDKLHGTLESKRVTLQKQIDSLVKEGKEVTEESDNLVNINELHDAIRKLQTVGDEDKLARIVNLLDMMDVDNDGRVEIEHVSKLIDLLEREEIQISPEQTRDIIKLLIQERNMKEDEKKTKAAENAVENGASEGKEAKQNVQQ